MGSNRSNVQEVSEGRLIVGPLIFLGFNRGDAETQGENMPLRLRASAVKNQLIPKLIFLKACHDLNTLLQS